MKYNIAQKWIKALRSGKYKQTTGCLQDADGYCCLGVLTDLAEKNGVKIARKHNENHHLDGGMLSTKVIEWADIKSGSNPQVFYKKHETTLTGLNDDEGKTFRVIAGVIERNYKNL